jgi:hypothetical protein
MCTHIQNNLFGYTILLGLLCAIAFNLVVIGLCEFLEGPRGNLQLGVFRYSLNLPVSPFDTGGSCQSYGSSELEDLPAVKVSQVCAVLAPIFGFVLFLWISMCYSVSLRYFGHISFTANSLDASSFRIIQS